MEAQELREYRARWEAVAAIEKEEQHRASLETRWRQLNTLLATAKTLGLEIGVNQDEVDAVRRRWNRLKDLAHGG